MLSTFIPEPNLKSVLSLNLLCLTSLRAFSKGPLFTSARIANGTVPLFNKYTGIYPWSVPISAILFPSLTNDAIFNNLPQFF